MSLPDLCCAPKSVNCLQTETQSHSQAQPSGTLPCWPPFRVSAGCSNLNSIAAEIDKLMCEGAEREANGDKRHDKETFENCWHNFCFVSHVLSFLLYFRGHADPAGVGAQLVVLLYLSFTSLNVHDPLACRSTRRRRDWRQRNKNNKRRQKMNTQLLTSSFGLCFCWVH